MTDTPDNDLAQALTGIHTDAGHLKEVDASLAVALQKAVGLAGTPGFPSDQSASWHQQCKEIEGILRQIRGHLTEMDGLVERGDRNGLQRAKEAWKAIQSDDSKLSVALDAIRSCASGLSDHAREEWNSVDTAIARHLESIHACALALRVKLELMKDYSKAEVSHMLEGMLAKLPSRSQADTKEAEAFVREYRQTERELSQERHEFGGFMDFVKGLAMWVETPEERMNKKRAEGK
jgi:hypothetical protein